MILIKLNTIVHIIISVNYVKYSVCKNKYIIYKKLKFFFRKKLYNLVF